MRIYQLTPVMHPGDGVSQGVLFIAELLTELGLDNTVVAQTRDEALAQRVRHLHEATPDRGDILLYHHSIRLEEEPARWLREFPGRRFLIYHNITPAFFFPPGSLHHIGCEEGRRQLEQWRHLFEACLADSDYNRAELRNLGYADTRTLPLLFNLQRLLERTREPVPPRERDDFNILFVGRIVENKCQHQLVELMAHLRSLTDAPVHLTLVGGVSSPDYLNHLHRRIAELGLRERVTLLGKVDEQTLQRCYAHADLFLSLSEHEGFCIPLVEAMAHDVPVAAYAAGAVPGTLSGAGQLLPVKHLPTLAAFIVELIHDPWARLDMVQRQRARLRDFEPGRLKAQLLDWLQRHGVTSVRAAPTPPADDAPPARDARWRWQIQGPYDSSYSLALVNRELARALRNGEETVTLYSTEGPGDYAPDEPWLRRHAPDALELQCHSPGPRPRTIALRNLFPPRLTDTCADLTVLGPYGWEESGFPAEWVRQINIRAHLVLAMSRYVADVLVHNGVSTPIAVTGLGADHILREPARPVEGLTLEEGKPAFLHISSCFPRKGADLLVHAFGRAFPPWRAAHLVIKTFHNPHNRIDEWLEQAGWQNQNPDAPIQTWRRGGDDACRVTVIWAELDTARMRWLYENATALVAPTRGEGFGLAQAEAMFCRLPVITTALGGQADFCTEQTAWLVPATPQRAKTHLQQADSLWFEPDAAELTALLHGFSEADARRGQKVEAAYRHARENLTWSQCARRVIRAVSMAGGAR